MHHYLQQKQTKRFRNTQSPGKWLSQEETKAPRGAWSEQIPEELGGSSAPSTRLRNLFSLLTPLPPTPEHHSHRGRPLSPLPSPMGPSQRAHGGQQRRRTPRGTTRTWLSCPRHLHQGHLQSHGAAKAATRRCPRAEEKRERRKRGEK